MKDSSRPFLALLVFIFCANLGEQESRSVVGNDAPDIDVYGSLTEASGMEYPDVRNILIGGFYSHVPMYPLPSTKEGKEVDPSGSTTFIDPVELNSITVPHPHRIKTFSRNDYIVVEVQYKNGEKVSLMVNKSRRVTCDAVRGDALEGKLLTFDRIKEIKIKGWEKRKKEETKVSHEKNPEKDSVPNQKPQRPEPAQPHTEKHTATPGA